MIVLIIFVLIVLFFLLRKKEHFILYIPIFTLAVDILPVFMNNFEISEETTYGAYLKYFRILIFILLFIIIYSKFPKNNYFFGILLFSAFLIGKSIFTSDPYSSVKTSISVVSYILLFLSALSYFNKYSQMEKFLKYIKITLGLYLLNTLVFTILKIGEEYYSGALIYQGAVPLFTAYGIMYSIFFCLIFYKKLKTLDAILLISNISIIVLLSKRTTILLLLTGFIIMLVKQREVFFRQRYVLVSLVFLVAAGVTFYYSFLEARLVREKIVEMNVKEEGRYLEYVVLYDEILKSESISTIFWGKDLFIEKGRFGLQQSLLDVESRRIHSDYAMLLFGGGITGLLLYLLIFLRIFNYYKLVNKTLVKNKILISAFLAIFITLILNGFADSLTVATARSIPFLFLGGLLGTMNYLKQRKQNETSIV